MQPHLSMKDIARELAAHCYEKGGLHQGCLNIIPSGEHLSELMQLFRMTMFPSLYGHHRHTKASELHAYRSLLERELMLLTRCVEAAMAVEKTDGSPVDMGEVEAVASRFVSEMPQIQQLLHSDVDAVMANDPASTSAIEVISSYPAITVMLHYRMAHALHRLGLPLLPRMITERAHSLTGIDIHPAATIADSFGIDHGTGIVIGETAVIGSQVMIYQGVTLGARNFVRDEQGNLLNQPRHPIIEDRVTIYSNTTILGRIRIGHDSVVGGNLWITHDVPPHSRLRQSKPEAHIGFTGGDGI